MARFAIVLACAFALLASSLASAAIVEHTFNVANMTVTKLCRDQVITAVNGGLPGPTIAVREGDTLVVHVFNKSPYPITIHWHGVFQLLSAWADGPESVTQCPIRTGQNYTYRFNITGQEGTLWWHAHSAWLRATVYGALILHPKAGRSYPFPRPYKEVPIVLGEWWNGNVVDIENEGLAVGAAPNNSDAYTINGKPGDAYNNCSQNDTFQLNVERGKTYMLRIINAALNNQLFFKIANHNMTVVAIDATYTKPYVTDVVVAGPGQTTDVLLTANQPVGSYYMAARAYITLPPNIPFDNTTTRGIIVYKGSTSSSPVAPVLPDFYDTPTAYKFFSNQTALVNAPQWVPVPSQVDEHMFITFGLSLEKCPENTTCLGPLSQRFSASMNNESFVLPNKTSMLEAFFSGSTNGVYTTDFPNDPPFTFNYTDPNFSMDESLLYAPKSTRVKKLKFNSTVEIVLQNTALIAVESHPLHLHGFNFHVLAQGFGNYDAGRDSGKFNLVDAQIRNTISVPVGGWAVIRFQANNPGVWFFHCHLDVHLPVGMGMAFEVENGPTPATTLPPPPSDLPKC
ncbi:hypothetical protein UlMin_000345 [Ulmus minor]